MNNHNILSEYKKISFGTVKLSENEKIIYDRLNKQMLKLVRSLPLPMQSEAMLFTMNYSGIIMGEYLEFFRNYFAPAWSVIYWISESENSKRKLSEEELELALCSQAMAMFLHSLDDHLNDGDIAPSHLALLLRSQAWTLFNNSLIEYSENMNDHTENIDLFISNYYSGICCSSEPESFEDYCDLFRKQMSTWTLVPVLTALKLSDNSEFADDIQNAYESFGIAWRILDDINDIEEDIKSREHSSIYHLLPEHWQLLWNSQENSRDMEEIIRYVNSAGILSKLLEHIISELKFSFQTVKKYNMNELSEEFKSLYFPL